MSVKVFFFSAKPLFVPQRVTESRQVTGNPGGAKGTTPHSTTAQATLARDDPVTLPGDQLSVGGYNTVTVIPYIRPVETVTA